MCAPADEVPPATIELGGVPAPKSAAEQAPLRGDTAKRVLLVGQRQKRCAQMFNRLRSAPDRRNNIGKRGVRARHRFSDLHFSAFSRGFGLDPGTGISPLAYPTATAWIRLWARSFARIRWEWFRTVALEIERRCAIAPVPSPCAMWSSTWRSRCVSWSSSARVRACRFRRGPVRRPAGFPGPPRTGAQASGASAGIRVASSS